MRQLGRSAIAVAEEVGGLRDMLAFDRGDAILEELRSFRVEVLQRFDGVEQGLAQVKTLHSARYELTILCDSAVPNFEQ